MSPEMFITLALDLSGHEFLGNYMKNHVAAILKRYSSQELGKMAPFRARVKR